MPELILAEPGTREGDVLIEESLMLDALLGVPVTVQILNGEKWATLGERTGHA